MTKMIRCKNCGHTKENCAKGLCRVCYNKLRYQKIKYEMPATDLKIISKYDESGDKICQICGCKIYNKQKKYCEKCKHGVQRQQNKNHYDTNRHEYLEIGGKYVRDNQKCLGRVSGQDHWSYDKSVSEETKIKISCTKRKIEIEDFGGFTGHSR